MQPGAVEKLTYRDFLRFADDGFRHELVDGVHYVTPSPATRHQRLSRDLLVALDGYLKRTGLGEVFAAPFDVVLSDHDIVEPDLLVVLRNQSDMVTDKHVRGAPAIVVEILSPSTQGRDRGIKRQLYERSGVLEYWLVDSDECSVVVDRLDASGRLAPAERSLGGNGDQLTTPLLPGFSVSLAELFADPRV